MEIIYRACDNTEFETEEECRKYEEIFTGDLRDRGCIMLDENDESTDDISSVYFVAFKTEEAQKMFMMRCDYEGYITKDIEDFEPNKTNAYVYDDVKDTYILLEKYLKPLKEKIERYENLWLSINGCTKDEETTKCEENKTREILFRAKTIGDNPEWVEGYYTFDKIHWIDSISEEYPGHIESVPINHETLGQFTGIKDKNDVKIFEGDIVKLPLSETNCKVVFKSGGFVAEYSSKGLTVNNSLYGGGVEVIGNIYDNPERLEETK